MLGKLIKHEWKSTGKIGWLMIFATALITLFGWLAFQSPMWRNLSNGRYNMNILDVVSIFAIMMYVLMLAGVIYGMLIYLGVHFYRTMYTDQGYLTHTLPVTKNEILVGKIAVSGLWMLLLTFAVVLSGVVLIASVASMFMPDGYSLSLVLRRFFSELAKQLEMLSVDIGLNVGRQLAMLIVILLLLPFSTVTILFGAISMGQLFSKYRVVMAIVCYIAVLVINSLAGSLLQNIALAPMYSSLNSYFSAAMDSQAIVSLLMAAAMYAVSWFVSSRKLNME